MARGRAGSYDSGVVFVTRRRDVEVDPEFEYRDSRKTQRISDYADEDAHNISSKSRVKDRELLNNITQKLHRVEYEGVKPEFDVLMKTGFRRKMYHTKLPPVEKESKKERRKNELRYPWDYTVDNFYRPTAKKYGLSKTKYKQSPKKNTDNQEPQDLEPPPGPFPEYDPMGVYTQRPKRERKGLPDLHEKNKYDDMNLKQKLVMVKAKVETMPKQRDASLDVDRAIAGLFTPLPVSLIAGKDMYTIGDYYDLENHKTELDPITATKIKQSHNELQEFELLLKEKFGEKKQVKMHDILGRKLNIPPPPPLKRYDYDEEQQSNNAYVPPVSYCRSQPLQSNHISRSSARRLSMPRPLPESVLFIRAGSLPPRSPRHDPDFYDEDDVISSPAPPPPPPQRPSRRFRKHRPTYRASSEPPPVYRTQPPPPPTLPIYPTYLPEPRTYTGYRPMGYTIYDSDPVSYVSYGYRPTQFIPSNNEASMNARRYSERIERRPMYRASSEPPPIYRTQPPPPSTLPIYPTYLPEPRTYTGYRPMGYTTYDSDPVSYVNHGYRPTQFTPSNHAAVRNARRYLERIERELGVVNAPSMAEPVIIHHVPPVAHVRAATGHRRVPRSAARVAGVSSVGVRSSSLPPSPRLSSRRGPRLTSANIEARLAEPLEDYSYQDTNVPSREPCSLAEIRSQTSQAKNKLDTHKVMMDRYLPIYYGPENDVKYEIDFKYGELVNRMPLLDKYRPTQGGVSIASIPPYKPPQATSKPPINPGPPHREGFRPRVSDTRKRIREVLCATKRDPHYYD